MVPSVANPLLLLAAGLAVDAWFGDMPAIFAWIPHPIALAGRAAAYLDRKLNRAIRSDASRRVRGVIAVVLLVGGAAALGFAIAQMCRGSLAGAAVEILLIALLVAQRSLFEHVADVARALADGGLAAGRDAVRHIVGRDATSLDMHGVARAAIESLAENFSDGVVAPVFWYLVLGLPGVFAYKMANTLDSMVGHRTPHYRAFGWAAARFDDLANLVPARISGLLIAAAALFARGGRPARALAIMLRDGSKHRSPNAGWPEGAMAGALGLALAGPRRYADGVVADPWVGEGTARAAPADIARALVLYKHACLVEWGLVMGAWLAGHLSLLA
ncbi:MAG TPA: adenosylcobinamide-phosphate synthase CbiB [Stellaceae bacterium]|jgi:adenosylcobinamide-phosphate synthase|nr:adenosylcobinamide-phosphate synthase CbiB [Stellaceae bacterium]